MVREPIEYPEANQPSIRDRLVEADARGRVGLNGLVERGRVYRLTFRDDGSILLEPARVMTLVEIEQMTAAARREAPL